MNKKMMAAFMVAFICLANPCFLFAQETEKSWEIVPIPIFFYTPETGIAGGAYLIYYNNPDLNNPEQKQNMIMGSGFYTLKKQISLNASTEHYFRGNEFKLTTEVDFSLFPDIYYGIGPDADQEEDYTPRNIEFEGAFGWEVHKNMYLGPFYRLTFSKIVETEANGELETGDIIGSKGTTISGGGVQLCWDERDSSIFPLEGFLITLRAGLHRKEIGSEENYSKIEFDYRHFFKIFQHHVLAFQYLMNLSGGDVPLGDLQKLGGANMLRGYPGGRYRDKIYVAFQGEYRIPIFLRFGGVLFGGIGQVAPVLDEFTFHDVKLAGGGGIRFTVDPREHINLRFDLAFSDQGYGFYVNLMEAF